MLNISSINSSLVRSVNAKVEYYNNSALADTFTHDGDLQEFTIERVGEDSKFFGFGICQKINVKLRDRDRAINFPTHSSLKIYLNDVNPNPIFYVSEVNRDEKTNQLSITGYDAIKNASEHYTSELSLTIPYTIKQFAEACAALIGYNGVVIQNVPETDLCFSTSYPNGANFGGTETIRDALTDVAEATQTIYYLDKSENLVFKRLDQIGKAALTIDKSLYVSLSSKTNRRLTAVCHATQLGDNIIAQGAEIGSTQYIRDNAFWELRQDIDTLVNNALSNVNGLTINQFSCDWRGDYRLEIGDKIALVTKDNKEVYSYLLNDSLEYDGSMKQKTQWRHTDSEESAANPSTIGEAINQTYARVDKVNKQIDLVASKTEDNSNNIASLKLLTDGISGKVESSVGSVVVMYALGESREVAPTDGWNVVAPYNDGSHFMWQRTITTLNNGDVKTTETCISGADGKNGKKGIDGVFSSVNSYTIEECLDYATRLSTVSWSDAEIKENKNGIWLPNNIIILTISCDNGDQYITTQKVISRNSLLPQSYYINYKGVDGLGIDNIVNQYYLSTSDTKVEGGEWLYNQPKWEADKTIWIRQEITWEDGNKTYTNPVQERALNDASKNIVLLKQNVSDLQLTSTSIKGTVSTLTTSLNDNTKGINEEIKKQNETIATLTSNKVFLQLKEKVDNGVKSIETETGYKFDRDGLTISKSNQEMTTQITENGMYVKRNNEAVLTANNAGVDAVNLHATTYLIVGKNSRFEDFGDQTACFWIGG